MGGGKGLTVTVLREFVGGLLGFEYIIFMFFKGFLLFISGAKIQKKFEMQVFFEKKSKI